MALGLVTIILVLSANMISLDLIFIFGTSSSNTSPTRKGIMVIIFSTYYHSLKPFLRALTLSVIPYNFSHENKVLWIICSKAF